MRLRNRPRAWWLLVVVLAGCKQGSTPSECKGVDFIFDSEACLEALTDHCRAYTTQSECWGAEPMEVAVADGYAYCAWTNVAVLGDAQTCEIAQTFGRCEAALRAPGDGPVNACADGQFYEGAAYTAFVDEQELVDSYVSGPDGNSYDTLLLWTGSDVALCGEDFTAPEGTVPAPEWCACAPAACLATSD